jgi:hypothetical protein
MLSALKWLEDHAPEGTLNTQAYAQANFPEEDPHWDPNDTEITGNLSNIRRYYWEA